MSKINREYSTLFVISFRLEHWDVNNENLHGHSFEELTKQPNITQQMFQWMHTVEPNVKLFLNDYNVITSQDTTSVGKLSISGM